MLFSPIFPPSPSPTESKSLFFTSVFLLLSHIYGHHYHLSKFCIYVLIYYIGVFLSDSFPFISLPLVSQVSCGRTHTKTICNK